MLETSTPLQLVKSDQSIVVAEVEIIKKESPNQLIKLTKPEFRQLYSLLPGVTSGDRLYLCDEAGTHYSITEIAKTPELGGLGVGATTKYEKAVIDSLATQLKEIGKPITLHLGPYVFPEIDGVINIPGNPKADFAFTRRGEPVAYISHKSGDSAKSIIHYGGVTELKGDLSEIDLFILAVKKRVVDFTSIGVEYTAPLLNQYLAQQAMYGIDFSPSNYGINNVHAVVQGNDLILQKVEQENTYSLSYNHALFPPEVPTGEYTPVLNARYAKDRNQFGIGHCRVYVVPEGARLAAVSPFT